MKKLLRVGDVREILDKLGREEISYSRMVELLNERANERLLLSDSVNDLKTKEAIDYEIYAKRKDKEENLKGWVFSMCFTLIFFFGIFVIIRSCSS